MKITIESEQITATKTIPDHSDIFEVGEELKGLLVSFGFHPENVDDLFNLERWESGKDETA